MPAAFQGVAKTMAPLAMAAFAVATLTEREALAFRLRLEDDMTFDQIGTALGISKVGARKLVLRAEAKVRELLADFRDFHR